MFYAYQLFHQPNQLRTVFRGGHMFQQYIVDKYCEVESERLNFLCHKKYSLHAVNYTSLPQQISVPGSIHDESETVHTGYSLMDVDW